MVSSLPCDFTTKRIYDLAYNQTYSTTLWVYDATSLRPNAFTTEWVYDPMNLKPCVFTALSSSTVSRLCELMNLWVDDFASLRHFELTYLWAYIPANFIKYKLIYEELLVYDPISL